MKSILSTFFRRQVRKQKEPNAIEDDIALISPEKHLTDPTGTYCKSSNNLLTINNRKKKNCYIFQAIQVIEIKQIQILAVENYFQVSNEYLH